MMAIRWLMAIRVRVEGSNVPLEVTIGVLELLVLSPGGEKGTADSAM